MKENFLDIYKKYSKSKFGKYNISYDPANESFEVNGYHDSSTIWSYEDLIKYTSDYYDSVIIPETPEEKAFRELREKAVKRNEKIDKILGE